MIKTKVNYKNGLAFVQFRKDYELSQVLATPQRGPRRNISTVTFLYEETSLKLRRATVRCQVFLDGLQLKLSRCLVPIG